MHRPRLIELVIAVIALAGLALWTLLHAPH